MFEVCRRLSRGDLPLASRRFSIFDLPSTSGRRHANSCHIPAISRCHPSGTCISTSQDSPLSVDLPRSAVHGHG